MNSYDSNTKVVPMTEFSGFENGISRERLDRTTNGDPTNEGRDDENKTWSAMMLAFTQSAGVTGVRFIGDKNAQNYRRLFWLLIVLAALGGLLYQISRLVTSFLDLPINVNIRHEMPSEKMDFPVITICNNNMFRYSSLIEALGGMAAVDFLIPYLSVVFPVDGKSLYDNYELVIEDEYDSYGNDDLLTFMIKGAHPVDSLIRSCSFSGISCGPENFTMSITNFGICYTFNSKSVGDVLKVRNAGQRYGLQLQLHTEQSQYIGPRTVAGFRLMVHGQDEIPDVAGQGVSISPGTETTIGLTKTLTSNLGSPYSQCVEEVEGTLKYFNGTYSVSKCLIECETDYAVEQCGCRYFYMPGNATFCSPNDLRYCYFDAIDSLAKEVDACSNCREPCVQTKYNTKPTYSIYPSDSYATNLYYGQLSPCDEALGFHILKRSPFYPTRDELYTETRKIMSSAFYGITYNGQVATDIIESEEFHDGMIESLYGQIYQDTALSTFEIFWNYFNRESDDVGSDFYNERYTLNYDLRMDVTMPPWVIFNNTFTYIVDYYNLTNETADYTLDTMVKGFYIPLYDEVFPRLYSYVRDVRDNATTKALENVDPADICAVYMRANLAKVNIYFEDLKVESIIQRPGYESFNLVCDMGGSLGLFFGASMVTFLEIIDFFIVQIWVIRMAKKKRQRNL